MVSSDITHNENTLKTKNMLQNFWKIYNPFFVWHCFDDVDGLSIYLYTIRHVLKQKKIFSLSLTLSLSLSSLSNFREDENRKSRNCSTVKLMMLFRFSLCVRMHFFCCCRWKMYALLLYKVGLKLTYLFDWYLYFIELEAIFELFNFNSL